MATVVSFHAHPDDEALLTGGYLAARAASGDRIVLVVATDGAAGLADPSFRHLGLTRVRELDDAADHLGVARVVHLGYADSGMAHSPSAGGRRFIDVDPEQAAGRLANILDQEAADVLTGYDARGGYGHPDHIQVHRVARLAQGLANQRPQLLEATRDRTMLVRGIRLIRPLASVLPGITLPGTDIYSARVEITHRVDVRPFLPHKRAALAAHTSQRTGGVRTIGLLLRLPPWVASYFLGVECFIEVP